jgi:hypothetical protein
LEPLFERLSPIKVLGDIGDLMRLLEGDMR